METRKFERNTFGKRLRTMLAVDFRRMFTMPFLYIMVGICLVMPILILEHRLKQSTIALRPITDMCMHMKTLMDSCVCSQWLITKLSAIIGYGLSIIWTLVKESKLLINIMIK